MILRGGLVVGAVVRVANMEVASKGAALTTLGAAAEVGGKTRVSTTFRSLPFPRYNDVE